MRVYLYMVQRWARTRHRDTTATERESLHRRPSQVGVWDVFSRRVSRASDGRRAPEPGVS